MRPVFTTAAGLLAALFILSPVVLAANTDKAFEKCMSQAESEEVADADLKTWIGNCLKDEGVSAADAKAIIDDEFSEEDQQGSKSSAAD